VWTQGLFGSSGERKNLPVAGTKPQIFQSVSESLHWLGQLSSILQAPVSRPYRRRTRSQMQAWDTPCRVQ